MVRLTGTVVVQFPNAAATGAAMVGNEGLVAIALLAHSHHLA